jgi:SMP-30/Gluconolactonase/LRE-like region
MNDGGCAPDGSFWCGSLAYDEAPGRGTLFRLAPDLSVTGLAPGDDPLTGCLFHVTVGVPGQPARPFAG